MIIKFLHINWIRNLTLIILFLFFAQKFICNSQNLYNQEQSQKFAEYLFSSHQHKLAAEEYERLLYFDDTNFNYKYSLVKSYRLSGDLESGIRRIYSLYPGSFSTMPPGMATEFIKLQILADSSSEIEKFIQNNNTISLENKAIYHSCNLLLTGRYFEAKHFVQTASNQNIPFPQNILLLTDYAEKIKFKSPFIAAGLSAIIPGTGKFYTKNWTDGIFSMLFVAGNAWQAYRGFNEQGIKSGYGWVFASLSASFYIGNIFGSSKAAVRYNKGKNDEIDNQLFEFVRSDSF